MGELSRSTWSTRLSPPSSSRLAAGVIEGLRTAPEQSRSPSRETTCNASFPSQKLAAGRSSTSYSTIPIVENMVAERELTNSHDSLHVLQVPCSTLPQQLHSLRRVRSPN